MDSAYESAVLSLDILLAEDSKLQAMALQRTLETRDWQVRVAENGVKGLSLMRERKPDLVVSDVMMPEMDGYEFCKAIKEDAKLRDVPVILLTTLSDSTAIFRGLEVKADGYVIKPYDEEILFARIDQLLATRDLRKRRNVRGGVEVYHARRAYTVNSDSEQILDLLMSSLDNLLHNQNRMSQQTQKLEESHRELQDHSRDLQQHSATQSAAVSVSEGYNRELLEAVVDCLGRLRAEIGDGLAPVLRSELVRLQAAARHGADLNGDLLRLIQSATDSDLHDVGNFDLTATVREAVGAIQPLAEKMRIKIGVRFSQEAERVTGSEFGVRLSLFLLLRTAASCAKEGLVLEVGLENRGESRRIVARAQLAKCALSTADLQVLRTRLETASGDVAEGADLVLFGSVSRLLGGSAGMSLGEDGSARFELVLPEGAS